MYESINKYIEGVTAKYLSAVDSEPSVSNQHEFGGLKKAGFAKYLGDPGAATLTFDAEFIYLDEDNDITLSAKEAVSWYDARRDSPDRSPELRLYYPSNEITDEMKEGDFFLIAKLTNGSLLIVICPSTSPTESRLRWLFGLESLTSSRFMTSEVDESSELGFVSSTILETIGIELETGDDESLSKLIEKFNDKFPATRIFSEYSRNTVAGIEGLSPDDLLMTWMDQEEFLFRTFERYLVSERVTKGFKDVDDFISFSLSVHNRRKSRAGYALENHLEKIFQIKGVRYVRGKVTENKSKPDFIFPGITEYQDENYPSHNLHMLGVKTSCKDRWRQVLTEAQRISNKHLLTLELGISEPQTDEMKDNNLQLVIPSKLHTSYSTSQLNWLINLEDFIATVSQN